MSTYKVIQDIEAEDKLVGPLTLRQFIYAGIAAVSLYLGFLSVTKHAVYMLVIFLPIAGVTGFFAFPFKQDQPTEVWALAKIRFLFKPRKRIWDQSGASDLVTITVPKKIERILTNGLNQDEVQSRLNALASTIDSRGWAVKNANLTLGSSVVADASDRLVGMSNIPQQVSDVEVHASDDILDEYANPVAQHFDTMITASATAHRQQLMAQMQQPTVATAASLPQPMAATQQWFTQPTAATQAQPGLINSPAVASALPQQFMNNPQAAMPTAEEQAIIEKVKKDNVRQSAAYGHMKTIKTPEELMAEDAAKRAAAASKAAVTPHTQAAIINLAQNNDLDIATIARQAHKAADDNDGEVVISLR